MDYGDGLLNGAYQFNTKYRKSQVCGRLKTAVGRCSNYNGAFEPGSSNSPPRRRRVPARRRSPPRRRRAPVPSPSPSPGGCVDKTNTNIRLNGQIASCQQLSNFCAGYTFVRDACPKTCGVCGSSQPSPTPRPTPQPTRRPTPRPTPSPPPPGGCTDVQSPGNCQYWKSQGFCESSSRYAGYMSSNCCGTCSGDGGGDSGSGGGGSSGGCTERKSVSLDCGICRETAQCKDGGFCCPFMKRCVTSSSQSCSYPIADCRPTCSQANCNTCRPSNGKSYSEWGKPTCGLLLEVPPLPLDVDE